MTPPPRVLATRPFPGRAIEMLREAGLDVEVRAEDTPPEPAELRHLLADKEGVLCVVGDPLDAESLSSNLP